MKRYHVILFSLFMLSVTALAEKHSFIRIHTNDMDMVLQTSDKGRLYQSYLGKSIQQSDWENLPLGTELYLTHGMEDYYEPAIRLVHNDGNPSLLLKYVEHTTAITSPGIEETIITLADPEYPVTVKLHYLAYQKENVIRTFTEIQHKEKKPVTLYNYASSMLHFESPNYYLTEFTGDWAREVNMTERQLDFGRKIIDTKLGTRANMFCSPFFILSLEHEARENSGNVVLGTIGWTGNFRFTFELDHLNKLRLIAGINPYGSEYTIKAGEIFTTPDFYFTYSDKGTGEASRNFHRWARNHQVKNGLGERMTLLNNWEATYFDFNEEKLAGIMKDAATLGVDMFLLDDGWFANKYPRSSDHQGLGDWDETKEKLPNGVGNLVKLATKEGVKFGIWIEPEMVSPKSELYEKHKDWVIRFDNREEYYFRNQLVLDLSNPEVQDYVYSVVDDLMKKAPGIAFFKWDCNSPITNIYSSYLKDKQSHLYINYVRGLYNVLERVKANYPDLGMMLCAGGGGRCDYEALRYFTEFWPSDNTDPIERIFIQWSYSYIFPSKVLCAHVTNWNSDTSIKFRTDVAMMCKLGFDIEISHLSKDELTYCKEAIANYNRLEKVILDGDFYRLRSPYEGEHAAVMHISPDKAKAVLYAYDIHPRYAEPQNRLLLAGLDSGRKYRVREINLMPGQQSWLKLNDKVVSGAYLMNHGMEIFSASKLTSHIVEITAE